MSRRAHAVLAACAAAFALAVVAGCANLPAPAPPGGHWAARAPRDTSRALVPDTLPSRAAHEVLATIPEPLAPGEIVSPPAVGPAAPESSPEADTSRADVPVPSPVPVLGERPLPEVVAPADTTAAPQGPPPALVTPGSAPSAAAPPASAPSGCWRVQIDASSDRAKALRYQSAGASQLLVPMTVVKEKLLFKVRTRDCMDRAAAEALKKRALSAGFHGVFLLEEKRP